ncbi:MAG: hypothetical protein JW981_09935 [Anaerolineae bacterium]|nr:hypothetical protein [Anaerolineae bacterium]
MEIVEYGGWPTCYRLFNGIIELIVTGDVGPHLIHFGFIGEDNEFWVNQEVQGVTGGDEWLPFGGHYLRHAPEAFPRTYAPANSPVRVEEHPGFVRFIQPVETLTGIEKALDVELVPDKAQLKVTHWLRNTGVWPVEMAPWGLSVMAPNGKAIVPLPPRGSHGGNLLPTSSIVLWAYTDMADRRWYWGSKYIMLQQEAGNAKKQKAGYRVPDNWVAYIRDHHLFVKTFEFVPGATYTDMAANIETYTDGAMLEVETLGPLTVVEPGASVSHIEAWSLFKDVPEPENDVDVDAYILPKVSESLFL